MRPKVFVHVGAPKTGTTYVQDRLERNARSLDRHGVHVPTGGLAHSPGMYQFRVALDLLEQDWGGEPGHAEGTWDAFVRRTRRRTGTVVLSHELMAPADPHHVERLHRDLAHCEVHVVYSARDLSRQVPAAWQETIKQGKGWPYRRFLKKLHEDRIWFYQALDLPAVLSTWGAGLPPERVHLVTVPSRAAHRAAPDTLWLRFCQVLGIDPAWAPLDSEQVNPSLGVAETVLIRKLNRRVERTTRRQGGADDLVRHVLAEHRLAGRDSRRVQMPPDQHEWAVAETERWVRWIEHSGIDVVGDLADLDPVPTPQEEWEDPDRVPPRDQLDAALEALSVMTDEAARRPDPDQRLLVRARSQVQRMRRQG